MKKGHILAVLAALAIATSACSNSADETGPSVQMRWETGGGTSSSVTLMWSKGDLESLQSKSLENTEDNTFTIPADGTSYTDFSMLVMGSNGYGNCSIWVDGVKVSEDSVRGSEPVPDVTGFASCEHTLGAPPATSSPSTTPPTTTTSIEPTTPPAQPVEAPREADTRSATETPQQYVALGDYCSARGTSELTADGQTAYCSRLSQTDAWVWSLTEGVAPNPAAPSTWTQDPPSSPTTTASYPTADEAFIETCIAKSGQTRAQCVAAIQQGIDQGTVRVR
ncbi:hypothetical protein GS491_26110 [Rhodococcus hoagii]|nr:hypothetical protein [Prescottella equi]NKR80600.1 hypothetical protein [Prescottella equi]NKS99468.1 hypothetical protein [Prescottella equi]